MLGPQLSKKNATVGLHRAAPTHDGRRETPSQANVEGLQRRATARGYGAQGSSLAVRRSCQAPDLAAVPFGHGQRVEWHMRNTLGGRSVDHALSPGKLYAWGDSDEEVSIS
jgi:hypothetical protein